MPSTYTTNIGIEKPAPGEQAGTWGGTVNVDFDLLDQAMNGIAVVILGSAGTSGAPNTMTITDGSLSEGRNKYIEYTDGGDLGADVFVQLVSTNDAAEKIVYIRNNLSGGQDLYLFQGTYSVARDYVIKAGNVAVIKFSGGGAGASTATAVFNSLQVDGITLPNNTAFEWTNAAGTNVISVLADASDDIIWSINGSTQLTLSDTAGVFSGTLAASNLSGSNTGDNAAASETVVGITELATQAEVDAGTAGNLAVTAATLAAWSGGGGSSPLTTKGDLYCFTTVNARLPVGTNGFVLSANSAQPSGLEWISSPGGGIANVVDDLTPQLGGDLDGNNKWIDCTNTSAAVGIRFYEPVAGGTATISVIAPALAASWVMTLPDTNGTNGFVLQTDGAGLTSWVAQSGGDVVADTTPQLGGDLDGNNFDIQLTNTGVAKGVSFYEPSGGGNFYVRIIAPSLANIWTLTLPTVDGLSGQVLQTNGSGVTSWTTQSGGVTSVAAGNGMSFTTITATGSVTLGTPSSNTSTSTNTVTASSHTHAIDSTIARIASPTFTGTVTAPVYNSTSRRELKDEVMDGIDTDNLLRINTIKYTLKSDKRKRVLMGAFADEMVELYPECVSLNPEGEPTGIDYSRLVIPLILKIQELEERLRAKGI